ncbi:hypothetical protein HO592_04685 [Streptococcus suis]|nr:hypothetical protein [Streptococcus suis]
MISLKEKGILLTKAYEDEVEQEANGKYQLSFKYPTSDDRWKVISPGALILADDLHGEQEFRVFEVTKRHGYLYVYAEQVANDLNRYSISSISVDRVTGGVVMSNLAGSIIRSHPFSFYSDIDARHTFNEKNVSAMSALAEGKHSILGQWGGDLVRDKYQISLLKNGGRDSEALFMYQKNLKAYVETDSIKDLVTRLHLSIKNSDVVTTVDSPLLEAYDGRIYELSIEVSDQDVQTVDHLQEYGRNYFAKNLVDIPNNSLEIAVTDNQEYDVRIFDTVFVHHKVFGKDLRMKITSYKFSPMGRKLKSIGFGKTKANLAQQMSGIAGDVSEKAVSVSESAFEQKLQKEIDNANRHFDAEFEKRVEEINDGIEQAQAEAERYADAIKQEIDTEIAQVNQSMQSQEQEHDREVANILSKTQSVESLANQAKADAANAIARANQVKTEAIADARAQVATVNQALNTAKTELQSAIASADQKARDSQASATALRNDLNLQASKILAQAQAQTALTNRVSTVESLADGTRSIVAELSKTVNKATGDIASVTSRTKTVEDTLSQTRTQYKALTQTVNAQSGQIDSINRKTADLQSGIDGVTERFESLRIEDNLLLNSSFNQNLNQWQGTGVTIVDGKARITGEFNKTKYIYQSIKSQTANDDVSQVYIASISVKVSNYAAGSINPYLALYISGIKNDSAKTWFGATYLTPSRLEAVNNKGIVQFTTTFKVNVPRSQIDRIEFHIYARDFTGEVEFEKVSLRRGNIDLGWQASPEDLRSEIATYKRSAEESSAELSRQIQLADGKAVEAKTYAQQTAEGFKTRLESLETYKDGESTRASQYFTASRAETAKQLSAERAAIATNYVAKSTYDENVRGTTLKLNEIKSTADTAKQNLATYQNTVDRKLEELTSSTQTLDGKINTASAKVDTVAGQIRTEIGTVEAKIPTEVGGRNYILKSQAEISSTGRWVSKPFNLSSDLLSNLSKIKTVTISCDVEGINVSALNSRKRYGLACSVEINGVVNYWEVWQTQDTTKKRISQTFTVPEGKVITKFHSPALWIQAVGDIKVSNPKIEFGVLPTDWSPAPEDLATVTALHSVRDTVDSHTRTIGAVGTAGSILDNVSKVTQTAAGLVQEVSGTNGLKTQVSQLAGSYAIQNLTSSGTVLNQLNLNKDGSVKIDGKLVQITGTTYIQDGVITSAKIAGLDAGKVTTGYLASARIKANSIDGSKIAFDEAFFNGLTANQAYLKKLFAKDAFITSVQAVAVSAKQIAGGIAKALNGGMDVNFDESKINFYTNVAAIRRIYTGHPTQFIKFETEGNYSRTIIGSNRNGGEVFNSATFAGVVVENTNNINTEDNVRIYGDSTLLRHAQGDVGWNINSVTQRIVPANMNAESEIWSKHFVAPDKNSKPVRLDTAVAALWDIWNHIIYNNFEFNEALRTHIKARRDNWKFELNL